MRYISLSFLALPVLAFVPNANCFAEEAAPKAVAKVVDALVARNFESVVQSFDDNLKSKLTASQLKAAWKQVENAIGDYAKTNPPARIAKGTFESTVEFSRLALIVRVSVNAEGKVNGLFMRPAPLSSGGSSPKSDDDQHRSLQFEVNGIKIHGTLVLPTPPPKTKRATTPIPLAVLHSGSGPTDRDGNQPLLKNDSIKKLAEQLGDRGIATFRYDKRGSGATGMVGSESDLKLQTYSDDLVSILGELRSLPGLDFESTTLIGHSEGAQICMLAAQSAEIDQMITIAGSGRNMKALLQSQLKGKLPPELERRSDEILDELAAGRLVDDVPESLQTLYRRSVQPFLISCIQSEPTRLAASLRMPLLIVQGDRDIQVTMDDAERLLKAQPKAELAVFAGMNHVLRHVETQEDQQETYRDPKRDLAEGLAERIAEFIHQGS